MPTTTSLPPLVSVVIPAFNRAATIERTLASVFTQTHPRIEVIVVDDASSDCTVKTIERLPEAPRIKVVHLLRNGGACLARNVGLEYAVGEYVAFLDSDDLWEPRFIEVLVGLLERADPAVGCAAASYRVVDGEGRQKSVFVQTAAGDIGQGMLTRNLVGATSCALMRRDVMLAIGGFNVAYPACQDYELFIRLSRATNFASTREILYTHIDWDSPDRLTRNPRKRLAALLRLRRDYLRSHLKCSRLARAVFANYVSDQLMRAGRPRAALKLFLFYAAVHKTDVKNVLRIVMALLRFTPERYLASLSLLTGIKCALLALFGSVTFSRGSAGHQGTRRHV